MTSEAQVMRQLQAAWEAPPEPSEEELRDEWICDRATELWACPYDAQCILEYEGLWLSQVEIIRLVAERARLFRQSCADDTSADQCIRDLLDAMDVWFLDAAKRDLELRQEWSGDHDD